MTNHLKSEPESVQRNCEVVGVIDEKSRLLDRLFLDEFTQE